MLRQFLAFAAALATAACAVVPDSGVSSASTGIAPGQLSETTMKEATRVLSSDEFEGREPGTVGEERTLAYLVQQFTRVGLQPGNNGSWFQDVPLVEITVFSGPAPCSVMPFVAGTTTSLLHVAEQAGTETTSPSAAALIAA